MPTPPYGRATAPWVRFCHILHSTHHSARSRRTRAVSDSTASSGRNSASSRSPALVLGCPFLSFSSTFRSRHQSLYLSSMVRYSNPEIQICKSAKDTPGATLILSCHVSEGGDTITAFAMLRLPVESRMREFLPCTLCATHRSVCRTCSLIWPVADLSRAL